MNNYLPRKLNKPGNAQITKNTQTAETDTQKRKENLSRPKKS